MRIEYRKRFMMLLRRGRFFHVTLVIDEKVVADNSIVKSERQT